MPTSAPECAVQARGTIECIGQRQYRVAGSIDIQGHVSAASKLLHPENLAQATFQIDIKELQMRVGFDTTVVDRKPHRAFHDAAEGLRLTDRDIELAIAHVGGDGGSAQLGLGDLDAGRGKPQVEIQILNTVQRNGQLVPIVLVGGQQTNPGNVRRQIQRIGRECSLDQAEIAARER